QYLDPSQDPLRRRPQRPQGQSGQRQGPPPQQHQGQRAPQPYPPQQPQPPQRQRQRYAPPPQQQQRYSPPQQPAPQQPQPPAPRQPRQRSANPMRIPGLGCLKGCLFTLVLLFVAGWLVWELTPLQDWIGEGKSYWNAITDTVDTVSGWVKDLGGSDAGSGGSGSGSN
ncbi:serine/threonine protein kinase, partial [Streptomyces sp. NP-1717]|nr:serine/threonine protein kinase [Streptomyces sp. NP-1717]